MTFLQATLLCKPPLTPFVKRAIPSSTGLTTHFNKPHKLLPLSYTPRYVVSRWSGKKLCITCCTLQPHQGNDVNLDSKGLENGFSSDSEVGKEVGLSGDGVNEGNEDVGVEDKGEIRGGSEVNEGLMVDKKEGRLPIVVFLMGMWVMLKKGFEKIWLSGWLSWWPWHLQKRLDRLIADADAHPTDAAKQSALLAELNKHSPETVIRRFEQRVHAVDSRGVVEYLRALVATNAISEYLPDEESGKPSSLPSLLQELEQRSTGNMEEVSLSPGISKKQPLHVMMVDPKASNKSTRLAQELFSIILFTVEVGVVWIMCASAA